MKNEYFQNDVIDLRILGDIGSVCIYRFPCKTGESSLSSHQQKSILIKSYKTDRVKSEIES